MKLPSFEALVRALEATGVRDLVADGLAVNAHGYLRFTKDVDLVVQLVADNMELPLPFPELARDLRCCRCAC